MAHAGTAANNEITVGCPCWIRFKDEDSKLDCFQDVYNLIHSFHDMLNMETRHNPNDPDCICDGLLQGGRDWGTEQPQNSL